MSLRTTTALTIGVTLAALTAAMYALVSGATSAAFGKLEQREARLNVGRAADAVAREVRTVASKIYDWSAWDDTYQFVQDRNEEYVRANLQPESYDHLGVAMMAFLDARHEVVHAARLDRDGATLADAPRAFLEELRPGAILAAHDDPEDVASGLLVIDGRLMLVASRPIITTKGEGPIAGTIVVARELDDALVRQISDDIHLATTIAILPTGRDSIRPPGAEPAITTLNEDAIRGELTLSDIHGRAACVVGVTMPRDVHSLGANAKRLVLVSTVVVGLAIGVAVLWTLTRLVLGPLVSLGREVREVATGSRAALSPSLRGESELGRLGEDIGRMHAALAAAERRALDATSAKSEFLANTSHEIRTPLNGVLGSLELLLRTDLTERQAAYARTAKLSSESLLALINDVLDLSKVEAGRVDLEAIEFDPAAVCRDACDVLRVKADERRIALRCEASPLIPRRAVGDPQRLRQVVMNLVSNAIKFTSHGGVVVRLVPDRVAGRVVHARLSVTDSGVGIPEDRLDRLFKSFSQVDSSTTRRFGGTGLGLAICKKLVALMGGEIGVASEPGRGSTFWFTIPLACPEGAEPGTSASLDASNVMVSCDDRREADAIAQSLTRCGVLVVESGADAAIIGPASARDVEARARALVAGMRVVAIVDDADPSPETLAAWRDAGVDAVVRRPATAYALLDALADTHAVASAPIEPRAASQATTAPTLARPVRVIVAEDNEINQMIVRELLVAAGATVEVVDDGANAVEAALSGNFDAVLMDCQMPGMDGFEATRRIRIAESEGRPTKRAGGRMPIIALTANAGGEDKARCLDAGMDDHLGKPIVVQELVAMIDKHTQGSVPPSGDAGAPGSAPDGFALDVAALRARCMGRTDLMAGVLRKYESSSTQLLKEIAEACEARDATRTAKLAHTLKGSSGNVGANAAAGAAAALESAAKAKDLEGMSLARAELATRVGAVIADLPRVIASLAGAGAGTSR